MSLSIEQLQVVGRNAMEQAVIAGLEKSGLNFDNERVNDLAREKIAAAAVAGERVRIDAPFKLSRAQVEPGQWLLKVELLHPKLLKRFQEIVQRGVNTYDMNDDQVLTELIDGILASPAGDVMVPPTPAPETIDGRHLRVFRDYAAFQEQKEKMLPVREQKFHMMLGLSGELLELMQGFQIPNTDESRANIIEELGDMLFFLTGIRRHYCPSNRRTSVKFADSSQRYVEPSTSMLLVNAVVNLIDMVKKDLISEKPLHEADYHDAIEVVELMMSKLCKTLSIQMVDLAESNMDKLNKRYKDKFTAAEAQARADKADENKPL